MRTFKQVLAPQTAPHLPRGMCERADPIIDVAVRWCEPELGMKPCSQLLGLYEAGLYDILRDISKDFGNLLERVAIFRCRLADLDETERQLYGNAAGRVTETTSSSSRLSQRLP